MEKKLKFVNLSNCRIGSILAEDIINDYGILLAGVDTVIDEYVKERLLEQGIQKVLVYEPEEEPVIENYEKNVDEYKELVNNLAKGRGLDIRKAEEVSDALFERIQDNGDIISCVSRVKNIDEYTYVHSINVSLYSMLIGKWLKLPDEEVRDLVKAGLLHDIGKTMVPPEILNKQGKLEPEEFEIVKKHVIYGYSAVENIEGISKDIAKAILMHHEREDGSGYPMGLKSEQIHRYAKILAVADVYDAVTSNRVYKMRETPFEAFRMFQTEGYGRFDAKILMTFLENISSYYIGMAVTLSNGRKGIIRFVAPHNIAYPIVEVDGQFIDLSRDKNVRITALL